MATSKVKTKSEKEVLIQEYLSSGMQKIVWCKEKGIPYATFYKWLRSYEQAHDKVKFVAVTNHKNDLPSLYDTHILTEPATSDLLVEIGACKIHITEATPISLITKVMKAVNSLGV